MREHVASASLILALTDTPAAIHCEHLAGSEPGGIAHKVNRSAVQIFSLTDAAASQRLLGFHKLQDALVLRGPPVVAKAAAEPATYSLNWLSATGTGLLLAGIISGLLLGLTPKRLAGIYFGTLKRVRYSLLTIAAMLALGFTTRYAGSDATMGLAFASTGKLFPFFSALLGWLGVALTGSDTSSNVLFGNLQQVTAQQVGISPVLAAATNSSGGVMGKMIDAQSIVVAGVATGQVGGEGAILRYVFFHSIALASLVGILVWLQAYVFPGMIPH